MRALLFAGLCALASFSVEGQPAQAGLDVQPIFEGWYRNADGGFTFAFGYLNRNYGEHIAVPVGMANRIEPGGIDRGQPEVFYPRMNRFAFKIDVPKDFGKKEIVWTLTAHNKTNQAVAFLQPEWEIDRKNEISNRGFGTTFDDDEVIEKNRPPIIKLPTITATAEVGRPATLTVEAADQDHLPPPSPPRQELRRDVPPTLQGNPDAPVNVPLGVGRPPLPPRGLVTVRWIVYRGPSVPTFQPNGWQAVNDGRASVSVSVTQPGEYVLRAMASDGMGVTEADLKLTAK